MPKKSPPKRGKIPDMVTKTLPELPEMDTVVRTKTEQDAAALPPEWALVAYTGPSLGRVFPLPAGETLVGRGAGLGITLLDDEVSRQHARIHLKDGKIRIEDLGSTNGTRVNGEFIRSLRELHEGDRLGMGGHVLKLVCMDSLERSFHETLLDLSTRDPLTGLANRGNTLAEFQNRFGLSLRYGRPLSVAICDLDLFKQVNDTFGHGVGDLVLQVFGQRALAALREADLAGRIGGEEFLMILPETDLHGARQFAERLRRAIGETAIPIAGGALQVTCSLGVAERLPMDDEPGQLLARADTALYMAKAAGRNQVGVPSR